MGTLVSKVNLLRHDLGDLFSSTSSLRKALSPSNSLMLCIARAIFDCPAILILVKATGSEDTHIEVRKQKALQCLMEDRTSFVIAHRLSTIRDADKVVVINNGEIVEQGDHQQLLVAKGFYYNLYLSQFKGIAI